MSRAPKFTLWRGREGGAGRWPRSRRRGATCRFARWPVLPMWPPSSGRSPPTSIRGSSSPSRLAMSMLTTLTAQPRFIASLLTAFAALALLLAAAGLYSVASYLVMQRRRDIGLRMAIGASPRDVARQVVGEAGRWIIGGALVGCCARLDGHARAAVPALSGGGAGPVVVDGRAARARGGPGDGGLQACVSRRPR